MCQGFTFPLSRGLYSKNVALNQIYGENARAIQHGAPYEHKGLRGIDTRPRYFLLTRYYIMDYSII